MVAPPARATVDPACPRPRPTGRVAAYTHLPRGETAGSRPLLITPELTALTKRPRVRRRRVGHALAAAGLLAVVLGGISLFTNAPDPAPAPVGAVAPVQMGQSPTDASGH